MTLPGIFPHLSWFKLTCCKLRSGTVLITSDSSQGLYSGCVRQGQRFPHHPGFLCLWKPLFTCLRLCLHGVACLPVHEDKASINFVFLLLECYWFFAFVTSVSMDYLWLCWQCKVGCCRVSGGCLGSQKGWENRYKRDKEVKGIPGKHRVSY